MKKLFTIIAAILLLADAFAQAPQKMSYQAVLRNTSSALITSTSVGMRISILQGSASGTAVYVETQTPSTNANGLVSLEIGMGNIVTGTFASINWATGPYFIKTETDPTGGTTYSITGTNELLSVPYALFSTNGTPGPQGPIGATGTQGPIGLTGATGSAIGGYPLYDQNQIDNLTPLQGMQVYNTTINVLQLYDGAKWNNLSMSCYPPTTQANAGIDKTISDGVLTSVTLSGNLPINGIGVWSIVSGSGGSITNPDIFSSLFTGSICQTYELKWTISNVCGTTNDTVIISFTNTPTIANAGIDQSFSNGIATTVLAGNPPLNNETGTWSIISGTGGNIVNASLYNSSFSGVICNNYQLKWTITSVCSSSSDVMNINFQFPAPTANAGISQNLTTGATSTILSANVPPTNVNGIWTITSGVGGTFGNASLYNSSFTGVLCNSYNLKWTLSTACSNSSNDVSVSFGTVPVNAGPDQVFRDNTVSTVLSASAPPLNQTGAWSIQDGLGGSFSNPSAHNSTFSGTIQNNYTLRWTVLGSCSQTIDEVYVSFLKPPFPAATNVADNDGNTYKTIIVGTQTWFSENLRTTKYNDGEAIPNITGTLSWQIITSPAYSWYNNDITTYKDNYGALYNWYVTDPSSNGNRNVCPTDWRVPTDTDWSTLSNYLIANGYGTGGSGNAIAKSLASDTGWNGLQSFVSTNVIGNNSSGFNGRPAGFRFISSGNDFALFDNYAKWWSSTSGIHRTILFSSTQLESYTENLKTGCSIRCVK